MVFLEKKYLTVIKAKKAAKFMVFSGTIISICVDCDYQVTNKVTDLSHNAFVKLNFK